MNLKTKAFFRIANTGRQRRFVPEQPPGPETSSSGA